MDVDANGSIDELGSFHSDLNHRMGKKLQTRKRRLMRKAMIAPTICTAINPPTLVQWIPENVSVILLAIVTAGLANEVDEVNQ